jgi:hypothetical protein
MYQKVDWMPAEGFEAVMQFETVKKGVSYKRVAGVAQ